LHVAKLLNQLVRTVLLLDVRFHRLAEYAHNIIHLMLVIFCRDLSTHVAQISILLVIYPLVRLETYRQSSERLQWKMVLLEAMFVILFPPLLQTFRPPPPTQSSGRLLSSTVQVKLVGLWKYYDFNSFTACVVV
jgi:hypothetical protein